MADETRLPDPVDMSTAVSEGGLRGPVPQEIVDTVIDIAQGLAVIGGGLLVMGWLLAWYGFLADPDSGWSRPWRVFLFGPLIVVLVWVAWLFGKGI